MATSKTRISTNVSTKTRVAVAAGAIGIAAAALVASFALGKGSVTMVEKVSASPLSGQQTFDAQVRTPGGYGIASVIFTELPGQKTYNGYFVSGSNVWRADVDTTKLAKGPHSIYAQAVFINQVRSTSTATSPLTRPLTSPSTAPAAPREILTRSKNISFSVNNDPVLTVSPVSVSTSFGAGSTAQDGSYVIGGASGVDLGQYTFKTSEAVEIKKLAFRLDQAGAESISLKDGSTVIAANVPVDSSGNARFTNLSVRMPAKSTRTIAITAKLRSVGTGGVSTGYSVRSHLVNDPAVTEIRGIDTQKIYNNFANRSSIDGPYRIMKKSVPTVSVIALPTTSLSDGTATVARFNVTANASGDVSLKGLTVQLTTRLQSGQVDIGAGAGIARVGYGNIIGATSAMSPACSQSVSTCQFFINLNGEEVIPAGTSRVYDVKVRVTGSKSGDSIAANIMGDTNYSVPSSLDKNASFSGYLIHGTQSYFTWSDMSSSPHSDAVGGSQDWSNGQYVRQLPSSGQTLSK